MLTDLDVWRAAIHVVGRMQRLVDVADKVDQEAERLGAHGGRELAVGQDRLLALDLGNDTAVVSAIPAGVVPGAA